MALLPSEKSHLLSMEELNPPVDIFKRLHDALLPFATPYPQSSGRFSPRLHHGTGVLWIVSTGHLLFHRNVDHLKIAIGQTPTVAGLVDLYGSLGRHYFRASRGAKVSYISIDEARKIFDEQQLWSDVAAVFAFFLRFMSYRDEHLVSKHSYTIVKAKILEYMNRKDINENDRVGIVAYIQETTYLSRSLIYTMLSALNEGGYIKMTNGKLIEVTNLPDKY